MILLMMVMMKVRGGGAEELEPDDEGQLPVRVHQLAADSVLGGGLLVPLLPPPPRPPHHPAHRGQQIDSHITGVSAIHLTLLTITSAEECSAVQLLLFCQPIYNLRAGMVYVLRWPQNIPVLPCMTIGHVLLLFLGTLNSGTLLKKRL